MAKSLEKLAGKPELQTLLQKFYGYMVADEQMQCASPFAGTIEGPHQKTNIEELKAKLDNVGKSSGQAVEITALDFGNHERWVCEVWNSLSWDSMTLLNFCYVRMGP